LLWLVRGVVFAAPNSWKDEIRLTNDFISFAQEVSSKSTEQPVVVSELNNKQEDNEFAYVENITPEGNKFINRYKNNVLKRKVVQKRI
jgi:hypothetical protein